MEINEEVYQGNPVLVFKEDKIFFLSFGLNKAKVILENIDIIKKFVERYGTSWYKIYW